MASAKGIPPRLAASALFGGAFAFTAPIGTVLSSIRSNCRTEVNPPRARPAPPRGRGGRRGRRARCAWGGAFSPPAELRAPERPGGAGGAPPARAKSTSNGLKSWGPKKPESLKAERRCAPATESLVMQTFARSTRGVAATRQMLPRAFGECCIPWCTTRQAVPGSQCCFLRPQRPRTASSPSASRRRCVGAPIAASLAQLAPQAASQASA